MIDIFHYDTSRYRFREWAQGVLAHPDLEHLHEHPCEGATAYLHRVYLFTRKLKAALSEDMIAQLNGFVGEYGAPRLPYPPWDRIFVNVRVHEPGQPTTSPMHRDRDYVPDTGAYKMWLPFTRVSGGGALWIESAEGRGDMRPYEMTYGQALLFDSLNLMHGCPPVNDTATTRVSIDFIIRPDRKCVPIRADTPA